MYPLLHRILVIAYAVFPVGALALALYRGRKHQTAEPLASFIITCFSGVILGTAIVIVYAVVLHGTVRAAEVARSWYFMIGLLCLVGAFRWIVREAALRMLRVKRDERGRPLVRRSWRTSAAMIVQAAIVIALGLPFIVGTMMARRTRVYSPRQTPQHLAALEYTAVNFPALADAVTLSGFWVAATDQALDRAALRRRGEKGSRWGKETVILCGGFGDTLEQEAGLMRALVNDGYNVLAFDLRGHGESAGEWSSFGDLERRDVLGAVRWVRQSQRDAAEKIYALGCGIGGAAVIAAAADPSDEGQAIGAVAVYGTYADFRSLLQAFLDERLPAAMRPWAMRTLLPVLSATAGDDLGAFAPARLSADIWPRPLLVIHGRGDAVVPFAQGQDLFRAASFPKHSAWLPADHLGAYRSRYGARVLLEFFDNAAPLPAI
jgi:alpha-beta hydrolase superfamily lysophospholipase